MAVKDKKYIKFVSELKIQILQSRYHAAKLVNNEILLLYFTTGKSITDKLLKENWGNAVIDKLSEDLQKALPGLRGFSSKNLELNFGPSQNQQNSWLGMRGCKECSQHFSFAKNTFHAFAQFAFGVVDAGGHGVGGYGHNSGNFGQRHAFYK